MATTITVADSTLERFNGLKSNTGDENIPELSADAFLTSLMDAWEENGESIYGDVHADVNASELASELSAVMDTRASLDETRLAEVLADYLINGENLPERVADELGGGRR